MMIYVYTRNADVQYEVRVEAKTKVEALEKLQEGRILIEEETDWNCYHEEFSHTEESN